MLFPWQQPGDRMNAKQLHMTRNTERYQREDMLVLIDTIRDLIETQKQIADSLVKIHDLLSHTDQPQ